MASLFAIVGITILMINVILSAAAYPTDAATFKDDCFLLCTISPNSVKCFRCKNRLPMRFGKRGGLWLTDNKPGSGAVFAPEGYDMQAFPVDAQAALALYSDDDPGVMTNTDLGN